MSHDRRQSGAGAATVVFAAEHAESALRFARELRELTARGLAPRWHGRIGAGIDPAILYHLYPPASLDLAHRVREWRATFRHGLCCFRRGPGFVVIYDQRPGTTNAQAIIDGLELDLLDRFEQPAAVSGLTSAERSAMLALTRASLLLELGGFAVTLPYRLTRLALPTELL